MKKALFVLIPLIFAWVTLFSCHHKDEIIGYDPAFAHVYPTPDGYPDTNRFNLPYTSTYANGYTKYYYPHSNTLVSEGNYENGAPSGYWKVYYDNGKLLREGNYSNGYLTGYWKFYYVSGCLKEEGNYENNVRSGTWKFYYPNCIEASEGNYQNGDKSGEWKEYNENGTFRGTVTY